MKFEKGNKKAGSRKGVPNKKTEQWEMFASYCMNGGLEKFQKELNKLSGRSFVFAFTALLEFHKPKLARQEHTGKDGTPLQSQIPPIIIQMTND